MSKERKCERCGEGVETCVFGNFYECSLCDAPSIEEVVARARPLRPEDSQDSVNEYRKAAKAPPPFGFPYISSPNYYYPYIDWGDI